MSITTFNSEDFCGRIPKKILKKNTGKHGTTMIFASLFLVHMNPSILISQNIH